MRRPHGTPFYAMGRWRKVTRKGHNNLGWAKGWWYRAINPRRPRLALIREAVVEGECMAWTVGKAHDYGTWFRGSRFS